MKEIAKDLETMILLSCLIQPIRKEKVVPRRQRVLQTADVNER